MSFGPGSDYKGNLFLDDVVQYYYPLSSVTAIKLSTSSPLSVWVDVSSQVLLSVCAATMTSHVKYELSLQVANCHAQHELEVAFYHYH